MTNASFHYDGVGNMTSDGTYAINQYFPLAK